MCMLQPTLSVNQQQRSQFSDYSSSSSRWRYAQQSKNYPHSTQESLCNNPCWIQEVPRNRELTEQEQGGELSLHMEEEEEEEETREVKDLHYNKLQKNLLFCSYQKHHVLDDYTSKAVSLVALLKDCAEHTDLQRGNRLHAQIVRTGLLEKNVFIGSSLINMYAKCGALAKAHELFDELPAWNVVLWNALIAGYAQHGHDEVALQCFDYMRHEGFSPNAVTFSCVLKACGSLGALDKGQEIHTQIIEERLLERNIVVANALLDMYAKCGALEKAQELFDELPLKNEVSWTILIAGYTRHGCGEEALCCFKQMQSRGLSPDAVTFACILKACSSLKALEEGQEVHLQIVRAGLHDIHVGTALVDMYAKCGALRKAQEVFDKLPIRNLVSWNALVSGYAQHNYGEEALICFEWMQAEGFSPDTVTFICILKACGSIGAVYKGQEIHANIVRFGLLEEGMVVVATVLVDMYANCGMLTEAQLLFDKLPIEDVISWSALMVGYAQIGKGETVFSLFERMICRGTKPDLATFTVLLNTCSQNGILEKGEIYFEYISKDHGIMPVSEHYTCMVDLFARAGCLEKAVAVVQDMPLSADLTMWHTFLGACRKWGHMESGTWAFEHAVQVDKKDAGAYISMSNIYAAAGRKENLHISVKKQAWKNQEYCWWINTEGIVHSFCIGDERHLQRKDVDMACELAQDGFLQDSHDTSNGVKVDGLCGHSERLVIRHALINTPKATHIHIVKSFRICGDCHFTISVLSELEKCKISVRDANQLHIFEGGKCSCYEFWVATCKV